MNTLLGSLLGTPLWTHLRSHLYRAEHRREQKRVEAAAEAIDYRIRPKTNLNAMKPGHATATRTGPQQSAGES